MVEVIDNTEKKRFSLGSGMNVRWFDLPKLALGEMFDKTFGALAQIQARAVQNPDYSMRPLDAILTRREREAEMHRRSAEQVAIIAARHVVPVLEAIAVFWAYMADEITQVREQLDVLRKQQEITRERFEAYGSALDVISGGGRASDPPRKSLAQMADEIDLLSRQVARLRGLVEPSE